MLAAAGKALASAKRWAGSRQCMQQNGAQAVVDTTIEFAAAVSIVLAPAVHRPVESVASTGGLPASNSTSTRAAEKRPWRAWARRRWPLRETDSQWCRPEPTAVSRLQLIAAVRRCQKSITRASAASAEYLGLRSRCTTPAACATAMASSTSIINATAAAAGRAIFLSNWSASAGDVLKHQIGLAVWISASYTGTILGAARPTLRASCNHWATDWSSGRRPPAAL